MPEETNGDSQKTLLLVTTVKYRADRKYTVKLKENISFYNIDTDEIPGFFLLLKNHIFIVRSEDTIFIFHV